MKATSSVLWRMSQHYQEQDLYHDLRLDFQLHDEDLQLAVKAMQYINDLEGSVQQDLADFLQSCITREIHMLTEARTGQPFVLRMDRNKGAKS